MEKDIAKELIDKIDEGRFGPYGSNYYVHNRILNNTPNAKELLSATKRRKKAKDVQITIDDFKGGSNSLVEEARMDTKFAKEIVNMMQVQDGLWKTRWGTVYFGRS